MGQKGGKTEERKERGGRVVEEACWGEMRNRREVSLRTGVERIRKIVKINAYRHLSARANTDKYKFLILVNYGAGKTQEHLL